MDITVILMLSIGALLAAAGYILPEKRKSKADTSREEARIREYVEQILKETESRIEDTAEEAVQHVSEKTERALERLTNEKIQAVHEYSDTVLKEINRNHEEVMFLYDMLNDKQKQIKKTASDVGKLAQKAEENAKDAQIASEQAAAKIQEESEAVLAELQHALNKAMADPKEQAVLSGVINTEDVQGQPEEADGGHFTEGLPGAEVLQARDVPDSSKARKTAAGSRKKAVKAEESVKKTASAKKSAGTGNWRKDTDVKAGQPEEIQIQFAASDGTAQNNNTRILSLHKLGKSNMAIAKELGLGLGEVKLVIDLFEGI